ncbi:MAG: hypothetical protein ACRDR6_06480 [Pseudonocardiaceae bacterium]
MIGIALALFLPYVLVNHWHSGTVITSGALMVGDVTGLTAGLALLGRHHMTGTPGSTSQNFSYLRYQAVIVLVMAVFLGITIGAVADLDHGLKINYFGGYLIQGLLAGAAISVIFGAVGVADRPVPLTIPWAGRGRARRRPPPWRIAVAVASFFFGGALSELTNIGSIERGYVIPVLAGATFGVAAWLWTGVRRLEPSAVARSRRHPMPHRLHRDFASGVLRCLTVGLFFGLVLGTVSGAVAGWRAEMTRVSQREAR